MEEILQEVRTKVLVGPDARIKDYTGAGPLWAWTRIILVRTTLNRLRRPATVDLEEVLDTLASGDSLGPDLAAEQRRHLPRVKVALEDALIALPSADRLLLKLHFVDGLGVRRLAQFLGVHYVTAARRLVAIRRTVLSSVMTRMQMKFGTSPSEFNSLWRLVGSETVVTLTRVLV